MMSPHSEDGFNQNPNPPQGSSQSNTGDVRNKAGELANQVKAEADSKLGELRSEAAGKVSTLADSAKAAARELEGSDLGQLSGYVMRMADSMTRLSGSLREKSGDDLLREVSRLARENPALFIGGGIAIGFGLSRLAKASASETGQSADVGVPYSGGESLPSYAGIDTLSTQQSGYPMSAQGSYTPSSGATGQENLL